MDRPKIEAETDRLIIRPVMECDKDAYMFLRASVSDLALAYKALPGFSDYEWESELEGEDSLHFSVFQKTDGRFVASASIQDYQRETVELGYDVVEGYRNLGYATEIAKSLMEKVHDLFPEAKILVKMRKDNEASKRVAEKCGGVFAGYEDTIVSKTTKKALANCDGESARDEKKREELQRVIEKGKNGVLVYSL